MLDGLVVTTVEHIADQRSPAPSARGDDYPQLWQPLCGFCTPGFVISLVAGWRQGMQWTRQEIEDLIAGICAVVPCYGPIVTAAEHLAQYDALNGKRAALMMRSAGSIPIT